MAQICAEVNMTEKEKERLRLNLMTKGLSSGTGLGRGRRVMQPNRSPLTKITKQVNKTIKCDMCKKEFPANVDESILINHVKTVHMNKKEEVSSMLDLRIIDINDENNTKQYNKAKEVAPKVPESENTPSPNKKSKIENDDKHEDVDEDQIVADVDDILNETDNNKTEEK